MISFLGEYPRQLDERGRFILPAKVREKLSGTVYVAPSPIDKCLNLYPEDEWEIIAKKVSELPTVTIAMTDDIPMIIPSMVSSERILFDLRLVRASRMFSQNNIILPPPFLCRA